MMNTIINGSDNDKSRVVLDKWEINKMLMRLIALLWVAYIKKHTLNDKWSFFTILLGVESQKQSINIVASNLNIKISFTYKDVNIITSMII